MPSCQTTLGISGWIPAAAFPAWPGATSTPSPTAKPTTWQKRSEEEQVERGSGVRQDGVGRGGQAVGEDEEDEGGGVGCGHGKHAPVPSAARAGKRGEQHHGRHRGAKTGHLPTGEVGCF